MGMKLTVREAELEPQGSSLKPAFAFSCVTFIKKLNLLRCLSVLCA